MDDRVQRAEALLERLESIRRELGPPDLPPGVTCGLSLMVAQVGSQVWSMVRLVSIEPPRIRVVSEGVSIREGEIVLRWTGHPVGDISFRMDVESAEPAPDSSGLLLTLLARSLTGEGADVTGV